MTVKKLGILTLHCCMAVVLLVLAACDTGSNSPSSAPFPTDSSTNTATSSDSIILPAGVTITAVSGDNSICMSDCMDEFDPSCFAACNPESLECIMNCYSQMSCVRGAFTLSLSFQNTLATAQTVTVPAGMVFEPASSDAQTMITIQVETLNVATGTSTLCIPVYCIDADLSSPGSSDTYDIQATITDSCLQRVIGYVQGATLNTLDYTRIQNIVWTCRDPNQDVSAEDWAYLDSLQ